MKLLSAKKKTLQKILSKIAVYCFICNFDMALHNMQISHSELSRTAGKVENAFNKTKNEMEDPRLSSFLRYWWAARKIRNDRQRRKHTYRLDFQALIDKNIENILSAAAEIRDCEWKSFIIENEKLFNSLDVYIKLFKNKRLLTEQELEVYLEVKRVIENTKK